MVQSLFDRQANKKKKHCSGQKRRCSFNGVYMPKISTLNMDLFVIFSTHSIILVRLCSYRAVLRY
jgi:hypothetical protein